MLLIRGCTTLSDSGASEPTDILISGNRIEHIGKNLPQTDCEVLDGRGRLAIPGLVNAHLHSSEVLLRGSYDRLSFDVWGLYVYPLFRPRPLPARLIYLRTALVAVESLRSGVTCVVDDVADETLSIEALAAVFQAYSDVGIRCNCSGNVMDLDPISGLPYASDVLSPDARRLVGTMTFPTPAEYREFAEEAIARFHDPTGACRFVVAPVAPQWCSEDMIATCVNLAESHRLNLLVHLLETKEQAVTSRLWGRGGFIDYLRGLGALRPGTTIAHGVWLQEWELDELAEAGCAVAHNPIANLRLGVGTAPVQAMLDRGIPVGLGTDGLAINDRPDMFEVMRQAALLSRSLSPDPERWLGAEDVFSSATRGGAQCAALEDDVGELRCGYKADLVLLRMEHEPLVRERMINSVVFSGGTDCVECVIVDGRMVLRDGAPLGLKMTEIQAELSEYVPFLREWQRDTERANAELGPYLEQIHSRCVATDIGYSRWGPEIASGRDVIQRRRVEA